jgi:hypothetical protein
MQSTWKRSLVLAAALASLPVAAEAAPAPLDESGLRVGIQIDGRGVHGYAGFSRVVREHPRHGPQAGRHTVRTIERLPVSSCEPRVLPVRVGRSWVPGHYEWRYREVRVPGRWVLAPVEPVYETRVYRGCARTVRIERAPRRVWEPARTEVVKERIWIPGRWVPRY